MCHDGGFPSITSVNVRRFGVGFGSGSGFGFGCGFTFGRGFVFGLGFTFGSGFVLCLPFGLWGFNSGGQFAFPNGGFRLTDLEWYM